VAATLERIVVDDRSRRPGVRETVDLVSIVATRRSEVDRQGLVRTARQTGEDFEEEEAREEQLSRSRFVDDAAAVDSDDDAYED
jgi:hypothetical protein